MNRKTKSSRSPIKWAGGKSRFRKQIVQLLPLHKCYVEPFAGAAWVLFAKDKSDVEVINDIDGELINFFSVVKKSPKRFVNSFKWELTSRQKYISLAKTDTSTLSEIQRAHRFFYIIMAGWGGEGEYPRFQTSILDGGHGNRLIGALKDLENRIFPAYERLKTVIIENLDWQDCVKRYDSPNTLMYFDPPYPNNGVNYTHNMREIVEHEKLAAWLKNCESKWILSTYNKPEIMDIYHSTEYSFIPVKRYSGMKASKNGKKMKINDELLIINYDR